MANHNSWAAPPGKHTSFNPAVTFAEVADSGPDPPGTYRDTTIRDSIVKETGVEEKGKEPQPPWQGPEATPFADHYMTKAVKHDSHHRPFSEQPTLYPTQSIPPHYGNEHEAARAAAFAANSEYIEDIDKSNLVEPATRNTKGARFKRHCLRYWICYLIANVILLAILLPIL